MATANGGFVVVLVVIFYRTASKRIIQTESTRLHVVLETNEPRTLYTVTIDLIFSTCNRELFNFVSVVWALTLRKDVLRCVSPRENY